MAVDPETLQQIIRSEFADAKDYADELGSKRARALRYYRGDPLGNEEDGRSQVVSREVADSVRFILASLMRVFCGGQKVVEYQPTGPEDVKGAEQATAVVGYQVMSQNQGYLEIHAALKDSLYQLFGVIKYWRDESVQISVHEFDGLSDEALGALLSEPGVEPLSVRSEPDADLAPLFADLGVPPPLSHTVRIKRTKRAGRTRIMALPGEQFMIDRRARDVDSARFVGHIQPMTVSELVALGYSPELVEQHAGTASSYDWSVESQARNPSSGALSDPKNPGERRVLYGEGYPRVDMDGDGIAELLKVCTMGEQYEIVNVEYADERPFAAFRVDPNPHAFVGEDVATWTTDIQEITTDVWRRMLDSLAQSINPRAAVLEGSVNMDDALSNEMGAAIRIRQIGAYQPFETPFVGASAFPVLDRLDGMKSKRTGVVNMALEADALQSTTKSAVNAQVESAKSRLRLIAQNLAETGMKRLFSGLLRLNIKHQDKPLTMRLRNEWTEINPGLWNADMDVAVNVGLGLGDDAERLAVYRETLMAQREVLQSLGPNNPIVGLGHVRHTLGKLLELSGEKDTTSFWNQVPLDFQMPPQPPAPDPAEILAQVEREKTQADMAIDAARLQLDRDKATADIFLRARDQQIDLMEVQAALRKGVV